MRVIERLQEGERKRESAGEQETTAERERERESHRRKRENARCLGNTSTLVSRAFVKTPWDASALGD